MDGDIVVGVLVFLFWIISSLITRGKARRPAQSQDAPEATPGGAGTIQRALSDLMEQMGVEVPAAGPPEMPVASEHTLTGSEHRRSVLEVGPTLSEQMTTASEHRRTLSEARRTASETIFTTPEHQLTEAEHRRGDLRRARAAAAGVPRQQPVGSRLIKRLHRDLAGGKESLARAIVLREILGPPVGLRSPGQDRG